MTRTNGGTIYGCLYGECAKMGKCAMPMALRGHAQKTHASMATQSSGHGTQSGAAIHDRYSQ